MRTKFLLFTFYFLFFTFYFPSYACFKNMVPNPSFEEDKNTDGLPDFWDIKGSGVRWEKKGCYGKKSVSIFGKGIWRCKIKGIRPHKYYILSLFVKRDGFKDGEYPYVNIFDQEFYLNELFSFGRWVKLSWFLGSGNKNTTEVLLIDPGMTHKLWFDDISLTEFVVKPISPVNGKVISGNLVKFMWQMPDNDHILDIKIELSKDKTFKNKRTIKTVSPLGNSCEITGLNKGKWYWRISAYKNRKKIATSEIRFFTIKNPLISAISLSTQDSRIANNKFTNDQITSFFPIGIYGADIEAIPELKEAGFNSVQSYARNLDSIEMFITNAKRYGLKALVCIPKEAWERDISSFFTKVTHSDSILAWYLEDEPEGRGVPPSYIWKLRNYVLKMDPYHPTALVLVRSKKAWDYGAAVDILMIDTYPIPMMPLTWLSESIDEAREAVFNEKPVWAVIQAFDWSKSPYKGDRRLWGRNPTYDEERCLTYLSIVHGARGIFYYTFKGGNYYIKDYPKHWLDVKRIVKELNQIYPLLLAPDTPDIPVSSSNKSIHYVAKFVDKKLLSRSKKSVIGEGYYLIAVNVAPISVKVDFRVPPFSKARALFEDRNIVIKDGKFVDQFGPYEAHIYSLK